MKFLPKGRLTLFLSFAVAAIVAVSVTCGGQDAPPPDVMPPTATAAPTLPPVATALTFAPTPTVSHTPTPLPTATATHAPVTPTATPTTLADRVFATLKKLTEEYSPRESATAQELRAALHLRERLSDMGYDTSLQEFSVTVKNAWVELESTPGDAPAAPRAIPIELSVHDIAAGPLRYVGRAFAEDVPSEGLEGRVALIERGDITFEEKVKRVADAGAVAAIIFNNEQGLFLGTLANPSSIPAVAVSQEDGRALLGPAERGELSATVSVRDEAAPSRNVIADKRAADGDGRTVIVGAHYDTVANTEGASDNGSGVSAVLAIAEHAAARGYPFGVRIILFGSEEVGLLGSGHYVDDMSAEQIDATIAMLNFDAFGSGSALQVSGDDWLTAETARIASDLGAEIGTFSEDEWASLGGASDHGPFRLAGVPALFLISDDLSRINSPADEMRHVNPELLGLAAEIGILLLEWLGDRRGGS